MADESLQQLVVCNSYLIANGKVVIGSSQENRYYNPYEHSELPPLLAAINPKDESKTLEFVNQWGLLGYSELFTSQASSKERAKFASSYGQWGDPLDWIWAHSRNVRMLLKLIELLNNQDNDRISRYVKNLLAETPPPLKNYLLTYATPTATTNQMGFGMALSTPIQFASTIVSRVINDNYTKFVSSRLITYDQTTGGLAESHTTPALLPVIYSHLKAAAIKKIGYYQCEFRYCKRWTAIENERRGPKNKYCRPDDSGESLCSRKERYHRSKKG
ncbi:hypothetical protein M1O55_01630 [Dehalococcoidia bacterium]|nr:hypothetical protein [Dehalococcoidia bacterium]